MDYYQFIGLMVVGLGVIFSLFFSIYKPLSKIVARLQKIEDKLNEIDKTLGGHSGKIDEHEKRLNGHDIEIERLKK